jgi:hypothetical protein
MHGWLKRGIVVSCCAVLGTVVPASIVAPTASAATRKPTQIMSRGALASRGESGISRSSARNTATSAPFLQYFGGHVLQHVKLYAVLWGDSGGDTYLPEETSGTAPNMSDFLTNLSGSHSYLDWMTEYSTGAEFPGLGSFAGAVTITPAGGNNGASIDDATNIEPELAQQIHDGHVPAPDANTLYVLMFRQGQTITLGAADSVNDFCAYHSSIEGSNFFAGMGTLRYAVLPYGASDGGCGTGTAWENFTATASHEVAESITDPDVGLAIEHQNDDPNFLNYLGWYDLDNNLEIADICEGDITGFLSGYMVVSLFSDEAAASGAPDPCVLTGHIRKISVGDAAVLEGDSGTHLIEIPVTLSSPSAFDGNSVQFALTGITATRGNAAGPGVDFLNKSGTLTFAAGSAQRYIEVAVEGDKTQEANETFRVTLSSPGVGYELGRSQGTGTILNDDPAPVPFTIGIGDSSVVVGQTANRGLSFPVTISRNEPGPVKVKYTITGVTAHLNTDFYGATTGTITIATNSRQVNLIVGVKPDAALATNRTLHVTLTPISWPTGGRIIRSTGTGTILPL